MPETNALIWKVYIINALVSEHWKKRIILWHLQRLAFQIILRKAEAKVEAPVISHTQCPTYRVAVFSIKVRADFQSELELQFFCPF